LPKRRGGAEQKHVPRQVALDAGSRKESLKFKVEQNKRHIFTRAINAWI
jgi:hypothetical protein